jgi:hypothetical protein
MDEALPRGVEGPEGDGRDGDQAVPVQVIEVGVAVCAFPLAMKPKVVVPPAARLPL